MAKTSAVEKNKRRGLLVKRFAAKRSRLKAVVMNQSLPLDERFRATIQLAELQFRQGSYSQSLRSFGPSARLLPQDQNVAYRIAPAGFARPGAWHREVELVREKTDVYDRSSRRYADPYP